MSQFRKLVEEVKLEQACGEDILDEGWGKTLGTMATAAAIGMGGIQGADAKTDPEALRSGAHNITAQYEHGGKEYKAISYDNYGGYSYGKEQISTNRGNKQNKPCSTFDFFLKYAGQKAPYIKNKLNAAGGWKGAFKATPEFRKAWLQLADQKEFQDVYDNFMLEKQVLPTYRILDNQGSPVLDKITRWGSQNAAMQAAIRSAVVQHGISGAAKLIKAVVAEHNPANMGEFIRNLYAYRAKKFPSHKNRYTDECKNVIEFLKSDDSNIETAYGHKPGQSGYELNQLISKIANNPDPVVSMPTKPQKASVSVKPQPQKTAVKAPAKKVAPAKKK